ncbi:MarR family winged helix-turn-helix transcriptional regulator [Clostridioides difficile]|nr:MarR family transcriptional regulator [Clostridioides difficile]UWD48298.1 MarR family transcriptional regulator [Clostridioides difficile]
MIKKLDSNILREVGTLSRAVNSINDMKYKELKLQKGQFTFLTRICENPGINLVELSNVLKVDKATTTKAIQKLIKAGYVDKKQDEFDKRGYNLTPTNKSLEVYELIIEEENRSIEICFNKFTDEEKQTANNIIEKMRKNIEEEWFKVKR